MVSRKEDEGNCAVDKLCEGVKAMKFLIQTRKANNQREFTNMMNSAGDAKDWSNYTHSFEDVESAKRECELIIQSGQHKAKDIRIVEVVCTFDSVITVEAKSEKY